METVEAPNIVSVFRLMLQSDNAFYKPYEVKVSEILEIWEYTCSIATSEFTPDDFNPQSIKDMFISLKKDINEIKIKI